MDKHSLKGTLIHMLQCLIYISSIFLLNAQESVDSFGNGQFDVFSGIQGQRIESGSNVFDERNINVFGDAQGGMTGSLSSPDLLTPVDNLASGGLVNTPLIDESVVGIGSLDEGKSPNIDVATGKKSPVIEETAGKTLTGNAAENPPVKETAAGDTGNNTPVADTTAEYDLPVISFSQNPYNVNPGQEVTILCFVDSPNSPIQAVTWMKNGEPLPADERYQKTTGPGSRFSELVIKTTDIRDEGIYSCKASNGFGTGSAETVVAVNTVTEGVDPSGNGQLDVFSGIQGQRVESGSNVFGGNNTDVFGDAQRNMTDVATGNKSLAQEETTGKTLKETAAGDTGNNLPVGETVTGNTKLDVPVEKENTGKTTTENAKLSSITDVLNPSKPNSGNNPKTSANVLEKPIGKKLSKPETKEAPAPQRDRIIGGIGGGGFISGKEQDLTCAAECRTNTDSCYRPVNCTHYETCFAQAGSLCECTKIRCAFGTFWNTMINNCDSVTSVQCESDPCRKMKPLETYPSGINCRSYYKCSWQNTSLPHCCDEGFAYDDTYGKCVSDETCVIPCSVDSSTFKNPGLATTKAPKYECFLRPIKGKPTKYWNERANQEQDCAPPLVYRQDICVCGNPLKSKKAPVVVKPKKKCDPVIFVDFTGNTIVNKSPRRLWIDSTHTQITKSRKGAQYGRFNGLTSRISSPYLSGKSLQTLLARFRFFSTGSRGPESQVLFSNCETDSVRWNSPEINKDLSPSVAIILNRKMNKLIFLASTEDGAADQVMMQLPYKKNDWNNVELMFDGSRLKARVRVVGTEKQAIEFNNSTTLTGRLTPAQKSMQVGRCNDKDGFYGYMDMVKIYDCIP
ncbi:uncharacterized protein LOC125665730 isoform X2 [Ostrea edulis]|uniref:uncharacterized protein LOC125665730 isoform X2 n=1 Tax=Ostrea edulis TaxID=37623 RepID=UPI0024AEC69A|nr:uncharacterized protein LOC125665730 isoform X2 [Ostrea edulis]